MGNVGLEARMNRESGMDLEVESKRWATLTRIVLPMFPKRGISYGTIRNRLRELKRNGYYVGEIKGTREDLWKKLEHAKNYIRRQANQYCPEIVREISGANQKQKNLARYGI